MNIGIIGYGKMGKNIEKIAKERGHKIALTIDINEAHKLSLEYLSACDAAIDFSTPDSVLQNIRAVLGSGVPMVVGTTGWYGHMDEVKKCCDQHKGAFVYGSNFSIGVNIFFQISQYLTQLVAKYGLGHYEGHITEVHHTEKLDSPSGTAITLAEDMLQLLPSKDSWVNVLEQEEKEPRANELVIKSYRKEKETGAHDIIYRSDIDTITLAHKAHNRVGFALGAVLAAEWIVGRKGFYSVKDMYDLNR